ncbi:family 43 glycosylhydrolase [Streptomyces sp. NBC_01310]|uniref:family 43 glycosylhydrolase n=1 Tax=Streptomyces sp. NBC_01310 TaxID=2903820 RepID=UPI0035B67793|nr:family 43 glycosylhydrolase [Streptomyces sp. NBC_01310]
MWRPVVHRIGRTLAVAAACAVAVGALAAAPAGAAADGVGPVFDRDFADPDIVKAGRTYHAYATNSGGKHIQHATSRDLVHWSMADADPLPELGTWAEPNPSWVWAPEVFDNGRGFTMHYTARDRASGRQCIGVALSSSPNGPFRPSGEGPLVCPVAEGGAIDAASHTEDGRRYLLWKNDGNCCERDTWLHLQAVTWDGTRTTGDPVRLIRQDREWEGKLVEAPTLVERDGRYVLFYSADSYDGHRYKTGYAVADSLTGPYTKAAAPLMTTESFDGAVRGPGGQDVVTGPDGQDRIVFHGWSPDGTRRRVMYGADLGFAGGYPVVRGSKVVYQAENARVNHAVVRDAVGALDGRAVGHIDHADSFVEFDVFAASQGRHALWVRFANGSRNGGGDGGPATASHHLVVNGKAAGAVHYPHTGWDRWDTSAASLTLRKGWNTVRLSTGERHAELDSIEVA